MSAVVTGFGVVLFGAGAVLALVGATMANHATGRGWLRSLAVGARNASRIILDLLP